MVDYQREKKFEDYGIRKLGLMEKITPLHIILLAIIIVIGIVMWSKNTINKNYIYVGIIAALVFYIFFLWNKKPAREPIPEDQIKRISLEKLKNKVGKDLEFPEGTKINLSVYCFLRHWTDADNNRVPIKWEIGFKIKKPDLPEVEVIVKCHPYTGEITGIVDAPTGYDGNSSKDVVVQEVYVQQKPVSNPPASG